MRRGRRRIRCRLHRLGSTHVPYQQTDERTNGGQRNRHPRLTRLPPAMRQVKWKVIDSMAGLVGDIGQLLQSRMGGHGHHVRHLTTHFHHVLNCKRSTRTWPYPRTRTFRHGTTAETEDDQKSPRGFVLESDEPASESSKVTSTAIVGSYNCGAALDRGEMNHFGLIPVSNHPKHLSSLRRCEPTLPIAYVLGFFKSGNSDTERCLASGR